MKTESPEGVWMSSYALRLLLGPAASPPKMSLGVICGAVHTFWVVFLNSGYLWKAVHRSSQQSSPSLSSFCLLHTSPGLFSSFSIWIIQSGLNFKVTPVSSVYHPYLTPVTWMHPGFCWPPTSRLASPALFERLRVSQDQQGWLPRDTRKWQATALWKAREQHYLF